MGILKSLKKKIAEAGGSASGVTSISQGIDKMTFGGGAGGVFKVGMNEIDSVLYLDKTWKEIQDAANSGYLVFLEAVISDEDFYQARFANITMIRHSDDTPYYVDFMSIDTAEPQVMAFVTESENGYPGLQGEEGS